MRWLLMFALCGCASGPSHEMAPPEVLARMNPNADTSHNPTLHSSSSSAGCGGDEGPSFGEGGGCGETAIGCGSPHGGNGGGHHGHHLAMVPVLGAIALTLRRRRNQS